MPELALGRVPLAQVLELELVGLRPGVGRGTGGIPSRMRQPRSEHDRQGLMHPGKLEQGLSPAPVDAAVELQPGTHEKRDTRVGMVLHEDEVHVSLAEGIGHHRLHVLQLFSSSWSPGIGSELELFPLSLGLRRTLFERRFDTQGAQHIGELVSRTQRSQHVCVGLEREHGHEFLPRLVRSGVEVGQVFQQQVFIQHERRFCGHAGRDGHEAQGIRCHVRQHVLCVLVTLSGIVFAVLDEERPLFWREVVRPLLVVTDDGTGSLVAVAEELGEGGMALTTHTRQACPSHHGDGVVDFLGMEVEELRQDETVEAMHVMPAPGNVMRIQILERRSQALMFNDGTIHATRAIGQGKGAKLRSEFFVTDILDGTHLRQRVRFAVPIGLEVYDDKRAFRHGASPTGGATAPPSYTC